MENSLLCYLQFHYNGLLLGLDARRATLVQSATDLPIGVPHTDHQICLTGGNEAHKDL